MVTGMAVISRDKVKVGTVLIPDGGFTCLVGRVPVTVYEDLEGLYVNCVAGRHSLDGALDDEGKNYVGFWLEEEGM